MSTNRIRGAGKKMTGAIKEVAGKVTGNPRLRVQGAVEKAAGSAQNALGKAQDRLDSAFRR